MLSEIVYGLPSTSGNIKKSFSRLTVVQIIVSPTGRSYAALNSDQWGIRSTTNEIADKNISIVKEYVETIATADVKVDILKKNETNTTSAPVDNTNYVYPPQTFEKMNQPIK